MLVSALEKTFCHFTDRHIAEIVVGTDQCCPSHLRKWDAIECVVWMEASMVQISSCIGGFDIEIGNDCTCTVAGEGIQVIHCVSKLMFVKIDAIWLTELIEICNKLHKLSKRT